MQKNFKLSYLAFFKCHEKLKFCMWACLVVVHNMYENELKWLNYGYTIAYFAVNVE